MSRFMRKDSTIFEHKDKTFVPPKICESEMHESEPCYEGEKVENVPQADQERQEVGRNI